MTKRVRIENADTSNYRVLVEIWQRGLTDGSEDTLVMAKTLEYPTHMTGDEVYLTSDRYIVIRELSPV